MNTTTMRWFKQIFTSLCALGSIAVYAQPDGRSVVASCGTDFPTANFGLSVTVGELAVQTFVIPQHLLTIGFQQPSGTPLPLPLEWLSFTARLVEGQGTLHWITAEEINSDHFDVQRSPDGITFSTFETVQSKGASVVSQNYEAIDPSPYLQNTYYRIRQVDKDGQFSYSVVVAVETSAPIGWKIFPNPVATQVTVSMQYTTRQPASVQLQDSRGRILMARMVEAHDGVYTFQWDVHSLPAGLYLLSSGNSVLPVIKMLKN